MKRMVGVQSQHLPIIETQAGDISAYIPTNIFIPTNGKFSDYNKNYSMLDLDQQLILIFGKSVGSAAQIKVMKQKYQVH